MIVLLVHLAVPAMCAGWCTLASCDNWHCTRCPAGFATAAPPWLRADGRRPSCPLTIHRRCPHVPRLPEATSGSGWHVAIDFDRSRGKSHRLCAFADVSDMRRPQKSSGSPIGICARLDRRGRARAALADARLTVAVSAESSRGRLQPVQRMACGTAGRKGWRINCHDPLEGREKDALANILRGLPARPVRAFSRRSSGSSCLPLNTNCGHSRARCALELHLSATTASTITGLPMNTRCAARRVEPVIHQSRPHVPDGARTHTRTTRRSAATCKRASICWCSLMFGARAGHLCIADTRAMAEERAVARSVQDFCPPSARPHRQRSSAATVMRHQSERLGMGQL